MFNSTAVPILDEMLVLSQIKSSSNSTNEVFTEFTTTANRKCLIIVSASSVMFWVQAAAASSYLMAY